MSDDAQPRVRLLWVGDATLAQRFFSRRAPHVHVLALDAHSITEWLRGTNAQTDAPDVLVLDLTAPSVDPFQILPAAAARGLDLPVLLLTPPGHDDVSAGIERFAVCDCIVKTQDFAHQLPASLAQVRARHDAMSELRRSQQNEERFKAIIEAQPAAVGNIAQLKAELDQLHQAFDATRIDRDSLTAQLALERSQREQAQTDADAQLAEASHQHESERRRLEAALEESEADRHTLQAESSHSAALLRQASARIEELESLLQQPGNTTDAARQQSLEAGLAEAEDHRARCEALTGELLEWKAMAEDAQHRATVAESALGSTGTERDQTISTLTLEREGALRELRQALEQSAAIRAEYDAERRKWSDAALTSNTELESRNHEIDEALAQATAAVQRLGAENESLAQDLARLSREVADRDTLVHKAQEADARSQHLLDELGRMRDLWRRAESDRHLLTVEAAATRARFEGLVQTVSADQSAILSLRQTLMRCLSDAEVQCKTVSERRITMLAEVDAWRDHTAPENVPNEPAPIPGAAAIDPQHPELDLESADERLAS